MAFFAPLLGGAGGLFGGATAVAEVGGATAGAAAGAASAGTASAYEMQATNAIIEGNQKAIEYRRQGNQVLTKTLESEAMIRAKGGAGGIDPFSGSMQTLADYAWNKGADEYYWAQENVQFAKNMGEANAAGFRSAASSARSAGMSNLIGGGLMGFAKAFS